MSNDLCLFGEAPRLISRVGDDPDGAAVRRAMREQGMDDSGLQTDPALPTGRVQVIIEGGEVFETRPGPAIEVVDTVGAGDALASVMILGMLRGWAMQTALDRAQSFASAIVGRRGATVSDSDFYAPFIAAWAH